MTKASRDGTPKLWFEANAEKSEKLPEYLQKLKNMTESENPVVMITKLKK